MEQPHAPDGCGRLADLPRDVQVTVVGPPQRQRARLPVPGGTAPARVLVTLVLLTAVAAAALSTTRGGQIEPARIPEAAQPDAGATARVPAIAAVYRYPLGCLGASLAADETGPASRGVVRTGPCWRYGVYLTAVLHRVGREWQLGLEAVSPRCPRVSLPAALHLQLVACRR